MMKIIRVNRYNKYEDGAVVEFKHKNEVFKGIIKNGFVFEDDFDQIYYNIRAPHHLKFYFDEDNDNSISEQDVITLVEDEEEAKEIKRQINFEEDFEES